MTTALITGCNGQDGSYLCEYLLSLGYHVHGIIRRSSSFNTGRIEHIRERLTLHYGDMTDLNRLKTIVGEVRPDEVYNLAAQSHVAVSFLMPDYTKETVWKGTMYLLNVVYGTHKLKNCKFYQASSSEMFGNNGAPQNESTPFDPQSPYAAAKAEAHRYCQWNRDYNPPNPVWCGILFNHESPRRGETFVTRKITRAIGRIRHGLQSELVLGNLDAKRDWGFAGDYVKAMHAMLQTDMPDDYVIGTGQTYSVRQFCEAAFAYAGLDWEKYVHTDAKYFRPAEVHCLQADATKARQILGWEPSVTFHGLVRMMVDADMELARRERILADAGA